MDDRSARATITKRGKPDPMTLVLVEQLKQRLETTQAQCRALRQQKDDLMSRLNADFERKLLHCRHQCQYDKERALAANTNHLRKVFDERIRKAVKDKDREISIYKNQLEFTSKPTAKKQINKPVTIVEENSLSLSLTMPGAKHREKVPKTELSERDKRPTEDESIKRNKTRNNNIHCQSSSSRKEKGYNVPDKMYSSMAGTLPRTPKSTPSKAFGGIQSVTKDEHEKEKQRWASRNAEIESQLQKSEAANSELSQSKAELNKRIVEMEKNQRPLIENNKKLAEKNRSLTQEMKKLEEKLRHAQDDYLTLRDSVERITGENSRLKEKRPSPEKLDELERYKSQNLEYSRCITMLRQHTNDKDRKIELLIQKLKRLRKNTKGANAELAEDDRSGFGSETGSVSSMSLDTITEDFEEFASRDMSSSYRQLVREHQELKKAYCSLKVNSFQSLQFRQREDQLLDQLRQSQSRIGQLTQALSHTESDYEISQENGDSTVELQNRTKKLEDLEQERKVLHNEMQELREQNELLEFQVLEMEHSRHDEAIVCSADMLKTRDTVAVSQLCDRSVSTDDDEAFYSMDFSDNSSDEGNKQEFGIEELKVRLTLMKHRRELRLCDKSALIQAKELLEKLEKDHSECGKINLETEMKIRELELKLDDLEKDKLKNGTKQKRKKQLQQEIDFLHQRLTDVETKNGSMLIEVEKSAKEMEKLRYLLKMSETSEKKERESAESLRSQLNDLSVSRRAEIELLDEKAKHHSTTVTNLRNEIDKLRIENENLCKENAALVMKNAAVYSSGSDSEQAQGFEKKYQQAKTRLRDSMVVIRDYEEVTKQNRQNISNLEKELANAQSQLNTEKENKSKIEDLEKQLCQSRTFNVQLETQFQLQLNMVQVLQQQLVQSKNTAGQNGDCELCQSLKTLASILSLTDNPNHDSNYFCNKARQLEASLFTNSRVVELRQICQSLIDLFKTCSTMCKDSNLTDISHSIVQHGIIKRHFSALELIASESDHPTSTYDDRSSSSASVPSSDSAALSPSSHLDPISQSSDSDSGLATSAKSLHLRTQRKTRATRRAQSADNNIISHTTNSLQKLRISPDTISDTDGLLVSWQQPPIDSSVIGYKLYVDSVLYNTISDVGCTTVLVDRMSLDHSSIRISLYGISRNGSDTPMGWCNVDKGLHLRF